MDQCCEPNNCALAGQTYLFIAPAEEMGRKKQQFCPLVKLKYPIEAIGFYVPHFKNEVDKEKRLKSGIPVRCISALSYFVVNDE